MSHAAEKCEFANRLAAKNNVDETLHTNVRGLGESWATSFVEDAKKRECQVILVVAGFLCTGISRNRTDNLPNKGFNHKESGLFTEFPRILSLLKGLAKLLGIELHHIIENVKMKKEEHDTICSVLNGIPVIIQDSRSCGSSRPRLFWTSFRVTHPRGGVFQKG